MRLLNLYLSLTFVVGLAVTALGQSPSANGLMPRQAMRISFDLIDLQGVTHTLSQNDRRNARIFVFLSTACPISNAYVQELNRQFESLPEGIELYGVVSGRTTKRRDAARHYVDFDAKFPILFDGSDLLIELLEPTHVPESFLIGSTGVIEYRGAIDNSYESLGRRRSVADQRYLRDAIEAVVKKKTVVLSRTSPVGCIVSKQRYGIESKDVTYSRDIAPLIQMRCQNCHRPDQVAPFSLTSYDEVFSHAEMIVEVTKRRIMPPWIPGPGASHRFIGERRLADRELDLLQRWVELGCPKGDDAYLPVPPQYAEGWQLGKPDLLVKMPHAFDVPAEGPDLLQNFVIPIEIAEDKLVAAVEFHPGNKRVVHHAVLFLDDKGQAHKLDAATKEPGYPNFGGPGFLPSGALGGWSVGNTPRRLPNDMGRYLKKGSDLVVQIHYHPTGKKELDQSEIGLYFVQKPIAESLKQSAKLVGSIWMANYEMDIPAGNGNYQRTTSYILPKDVQLVGIVPHMHLLGKSMRVTAKQPNQNVETLIDISDWNYNWQDEYYFEQPIRLSAGTKLIVDATFDNSSSNPSNPSSPPQRVTWGEETTDEMLFCFFLLTANKTDDLIHTIFDNLGHDLKQPRKDVDKSK